MSVPSAMQNEWIQLQKATQRGPSWWIYRFSVSYLLLSGPLNSMFPAGVWWSVPAALGIYLLGMLAWWLAARTLAAERARIEAKQASGLFNGWQIGLPAALLMVAFAWLGHRQTAYSYGVMTLIGFAAVVLLFELSLGSKRASFELLEARDQALRARLAPHFLFNTLNTLHAQIESDPRGAQATTERLAQLFRQVLDASEKATVPLREELAFAEAYLGIERDRLGSRLRVAVEVPEELEACQVPPLALQVLVENAVKHGIAPLEAGGELRISARLEGRELRLSVSDPGPGQSAHKGTGTALETLRQRLAKPGDLEILREGDRTVASFRWRQA